MKYRIYDTEERKYIEDADWMWAVSRNGLLYDFRNDEWHTNKAL